MATIIFDLDGTLVDLWPIEKTTLTILTAQTCKITKRKVLSKLQSQKKLNKSLYEMYNYFYIKSFDKKISERLFIKYYDQTQQTLIQSNGYPKFNIFTEKSALADLKKGCTLALVTGSRRQELNFIFKEIGFAKLFNKNNVICSDTIKPNKSTGIPFAILAEQNSSPIVAIGDSNSDKLGAHNAKIPCIIVNKKMSLAKAIDQAKNILQIKKHAIRDLRA